MFSIKKLLLFFVLSVLIGATPSLAMVKGTTHHNSTKTQASHFTEVMPMLYKTFENALDKVTMIAQEEQEQLDGAVMLKKSSTYAGIILPDPPASKILGWNAAGTNLDNLDQQQTTVGATTIKFFSNYASFAAALSDIGSANVSLIIDTGASITTDTTVASNVNLVLTKMGGFSVSTSKTLTINGPFDAGLYQVFSCMGTGKVVFGVGAVKEVYPEWWGAKSDGTKRTETTAAFNAAIAALPGGGVVKLMVGKYSLNGAITMHSGIQIQGASNTDEYYGGLTGNEKATFIYQDASIDSIFNVGENVHDISFSRMCLSSVASPIPGSSASASMIGIKFEGGYPNSTYRIDINNVTFYNFKRAISVSMTNLINAWQCDSVQVNHCVFFNNTVGVYFDSINADYWHFDTCAFFIPNNGYGVYVLNAGFMLFTNCAGGGHNAGNTNGNTGVYIELNHDLITFIGCQWESLENFLNVGPFAVGIGTTDEENYPITFDGCIYECPNKIQRRTKLVSRNSRYYYDVTLINYYAIVDSYSDSFQINQSFTPLTPVTTDISGTGTLVTVNYVNHGFTEFDWIIATGSSTAGYNTTTGYDRLPSVSVIKNTANSFSYFAAGTGTPATAPTFTKLARFIEGLSSSINILPQKYRVSNGNPVNVCTPMHIGDEVYDQTNGIAYKAMGFLPTDWHPITPGYIRTYAGDPNNNVTPLWLGEELLDVANTKWYKAASLLITGWIAISQ